MWVLRRKNRATMHAELWNPRDSRKLVIELDSNNKKKRRRSFETSAFIWGDDHLTSAYSSVDDVKILSFRAAQFRDNRLYDNCLDTLCLRQKNWLMSSCCSYELTRKTSTKNTDKRIQLIENLKMKQTKKQ